MLIINCTYYSVDVFLHLSSLVTPGNSDSTYIVGKVELATIELANISLIA